MCEKSGKRSKVCENRVSQKKTKNRRETSEKKGKKKEKIIKRKEKEGRR